MHSIGHCAWRCAKFSRSHAWLAGVRARFFFCFSQTSKNLALFSHVFCYYYCVFLYHLHKYISWQNLPRSWEIFFASTTTQNCNKIIFQPANIECSSGNDAASKSSAVAWVKLNKCNRRDLDELGFDGQQCICVHMSKHFSRWIFNQKELMENNSSYTYVKADLTSHRCETGLESHMIANCGYPHKLWMFWSKFTILFEQNLKILWESSWGFFGKCNTTF